MAISNVPLEKIYPNPYQPESRIKVADEDAERFGKSILNSGLILTPVGRRSDGVFEMGDGWLRRAGYLWLVKNGHPEFQSLPMDVRDLNDQQMADLVIEANKTRKDLNPIEEAEFYTKYMKDFKVSETQLAAKYNCSQGEIANTLRLLELPELVKSKVISREISSTHARQLLRLNKMPAMQAKFLDSTIKHGMSVSQVDVKINRELFQSSKPLNTGEYNSAKFNLDACEKCEHRQVIADPWGQKKKQPRCLNEKCWTKKQETAEKEAEAAAKKKLEKKAAGAKVFTDKDLRYDHYKNMGSYTKDLDNPAECKTCKKRGLYHSSYSSSKTPEPVCLDPKCYRAKETKHTKASNKTKREEERELTIQLGKIFEKVSKNRYGALVVATRYMAKHIESAAGDDLCKMFDDIPKHTNGRLDNVALVAKIPGMAEPQLVKLLAALVISQRRRRDAWQQFSTKLSVDLLLEVSILEGTYEAKAAETKAFNEANCLECGNANKSLVHTGEPCCSYNYNRQIKDGVCLNSPAQRAARKKKTGSDDRVDSEDATAQHYKERDLKVESEDEVVEEEE